MLILACDILKCYDSGVSVCTFYHHDMCVYIAVYDWLISTNQIYSTNILPADSVTLQMTAPAHSDWLV